MRFAGLVGALAVGVLVSGCSSSDLPVRSDGGGDADAGETFAFDFALYDLDRDAEHLKGDPIADALVAVDLPTGERQELRTGADGSVHIEVPANVEYITWTLAKPGRLPVRTYYRATLAEVQAETVKEGGLYTIMTPPPPPAPTSTVAVTLNATVPYCSSHAWDFRCNRGGAHVHHVPKSSQPFRLVAYATDALGCAQELREITLPDTLTDQTVDVLFDGSPPPATRFNATLKLSSDSTSLLNTAGPIITNQFPFMVTTRDYRVRGGACEGHYEASAGIVTTTVSYFPTSTEPALFWVLAFPAGGPGASTTATSQRVLPGVPGAGSYEVLDIPVWTSPAGDAPNRSSTFAWQLVSDATYYWVELYTSATVWSAVSWHVQDVVLPPLPAGYDPESDWGASEGYYRVWACDDLWRTFFNNPAFKVDREWRCSVTAALDGPVIE